MSPFGSVMTQAGVELIREVRILGEYVAPASSRQAGKDAGATEGER